jgi:hypothetical protein
MGAAGVGPEPRRMILVGVTFLKQQFLFIVEYKYGEGTVEQPFLMGPKLFATARGIVIFIDENNGVWILSDHIAPPPTDEYIPSMHHQSSPPEGVYQFFIQFND